MVGFRYTYFVDGISKVDKTLLSKVEEYISTQILVNSEGTIFLLEISFKDKDKAKRCGARWFKDRKHWGCNYDNIEIFYDNWEKETEEENKKK